MVLSGVIAMLPSYYSTLRCVLTGTILLMATGPAAAQLGDASYQPGSVYREAPAIGPPSNVLRPDSPSTHRLPPIQPRIRLEVQPNSPTHAATPPGDARLALNSQYPNTGAPSTGAPSSESLAFPAASNSDGPVPEAPELPGQPLDPMPSASSSVPLAPATGDPPAGYPLTGFGDLKATDYDLREARTRQAMSRQAIRPSSKPKQTRMKERLVNPMRGIRKCNVFRR